MNPPTESGSATGELPLRWFLRSIRRNWWIVLLSTLVAVGGAAAYSYTRESEYRADMAIVVGQDNGLLQPQVIGQSPEPFTQTIAGLLQSEVVADRVIDDLHLSISAPTLINHLGAAARPQSTVIDVSYDSTDRDQALEVLQAVARTFPGVLDSTFRPPAEDVDRITVTVFDPPRLRSDPVFPNHERTLAIAGALGLLIGIALALARSALSGESAGRDTSAVRAIAAR